MGFRVLVRIAYGGAPHASVIPVMLCIWSILKSANLIRLLPSSADLLALLGQHYLMA